MRNFITARAGASFYAGESYTFVVRQNHLELVIKVGKNLYGVVCILLTGPETVSLTCNWGHFFDRVYNHKEPEKLLSMLQKTCPTVCELFTGETPYDCITLPDEDQLDAISISLKRNMEQKSIFSLLDNKEVLHEAEKLFDFCCKLYNEIKEKCPFEGWKKGLMEI
ncbi:hypothetical protein [Phocaeicola barnesiae]|uniref:hypothetical protein n=1 Tax=Phocaeicola barnesiae TaxID=376804 RepID=UPI00241C515A|nr:hypothetical protein [Phocaeicola barnesiae]